MLGPHLVLVATAGLLSGAINAVAGGGSLILFPALLATGLTPLQANVTNSMANWPGYCGGVLGFRSELQGQGQRVMTLAGVTLLGSSLGSALLLRLPASAFDLIVPVLVLFASLLLAVQSEVQRRVRDSGGKQSWQGYLAILAAAVYGGYFGGALGVILLATLSVTVRDSLRRLNALKSVLSLINGTVCALIFAVLGPVDWTAAAVAAPATLVGGYAGARLASRINDKVLRRCIVVFGIGVSIYLAFR